MKHIGLDVHSTTTNIVVLNDAGRRLLSRKVATTAKELREVISSIPGDKRLAVEESQMADWVVRELAPLVQEIIRCQPQYNRLISRSEDKYDEGDAESLAVLLRLNELKPVHHPVWEFRLFREAVRSYWLRSRDLARAKNRLKAFFLFNGIHEPSKRIYAQRYREGFRDQLRQRRGNLELAESLWEDVAYCRQKKAQHVRLMRPAGKPWAAEIARLQSIPGVGVIGAHTLVAYLERGYRFRNKRQVWSYAGLGLRRKESAERGFRKASRCGNRYVKNVIFLGVANIAAGQRRHALWEMWQQGMVSGVDARRMRRNVGRKMLAIAQQLLRSGERYTDDRVKRSTTGSRQQ
jgi:transposase